MSSIVPKRLFSRIDGKEVNNFSNLKKELATYNDPIEINDDDEKVFAKQNVTSPIRTNKHLKRKVNIKKMLASSLSLSTGTSLSYESHSPKYCKVKEISAPKLTKNVLSSQFTDTSLQKSYSPYKLKNAKKENVVDGLTSVKTEKFHTSTDSCKSRDELLSTQHKRTTKHTNFSMQLFL